MDVADWGKAQHELHARIAPVRAREYRLPVLRVASSGISQAISADGEQLASAPFPGDGHFLGAQLSLPLHGRLPLDRWLAPGSVGFAAILIAWFALWPPLRRGLVCGRRIQSRTFIWLVAADRKNITDQDQEISDPVYLKREASTA
jgi:hypothetical protein